MIESESFRPISPTIVYNGQYTDVEHIRSTSHAHLYRMRRMGRLFIAKTAPSDDARSLELLKREYELSLGLSHPNIVHVYTYETNTPVGAAIIMEYIDGCSLAEYLTDNQIRIHFNASSTNCYLLLTICTKQECYTTTLNPRTSSSPVPTTMSASSTLVLLTTTATFRNAC